MSPPEQERQNRRVGVISHISKSTGNLIAKAEQELNVGDFLYDQKGKRVGSVFDFFGPIGAPYIAVKLHSPEATKLIGEPLFVFERDKREYGGKRDTRKRK